MKIIVSENQRPPAHPQYGDNYERGLDPWHKNAFPVGLKDAAPDQNDERKEGWFLLDAWGTAIGFTADGEQFEVCPCTVLKADHCCDQTNNQGYTTFCACEAIYHPEWGKRKTYKQVDCANTFHSETIRRDKDDASPERIAAQDGQRNG